VRSNDRVTFTPFPDPRGVLDFPNQTPWKKQDVIEGISLLRKATQPVDPDTAETGKRNLRPSDVPPAQEERIPGRPPGMR
jgi:hypothetical protein